MTGHAVLLLAQALPPGEQAHLLQARQMQALSFIVHIPLVCFGIAFPMMVLAMEWLHHRTGDPVYRTVARRWSRVMVALFAVGVITGTILSFEMGLLWPNFTGTFGGVFGLGFAIEGFSFFLEAIFIGIYIYGWDRLSPRAHLLSGIPIVITGFTGSLMVIAVNAWMNHPGGFRLVGGRVVDVHPWSALFGNSYLWHELIHMYVAAYIVTGFVVAAPYAYQRFRGRWGRYERTALALPLTIAAVASPVQLLVGDWAARAVAAAQPTKLAALEGVGRTVSGAPEHLGGWYSDGEVKYGIRIPKLLSLLAFHDPNARVEGLYAVPPSQRPPVNLVRFAFQTMVGIGTLMALLGAFIVFLRVRRRPLPEWRWFWAALVVVAPLSYVALVAGWVTTEVGRQPWVVYRVMPTADAVTGAGGIPVGYATLWVVYVLTAIGVVWILRRLARAPIGPVASPPPGAGASRGTAISEG
ncbi:MAG TPA: cytochrome ubiquinol oxidase subunit I [Baekduia sp.]|nr:cytochrome ubiquinol oxidase subunit I [Baekduia sp.]